MRKAEVTFIWASLVILLSLGFISWRVVDFEWRKSLELPFTASKDSADYFGIEEAPSWKSWEDTYSWIAKNLTYIDDGETNYWEDPENVVKRKGGDCEDWAILFQELVWRRFRIASSLVVVYFDNEGEEYSHMMVAVPAKGVRGFGDSWILHGEVVKLIDWENWSYRMSLLKEFGNIYSRDTVRVILKHRGDYKW